MGEARRIDWGTAEVRKGTLVVGLTGEAPKGWKEQFELVLGRLQSHARWEVSLHKKGIEVSAVEAGSEDDLRHLLESVVQQVDANLQPKAADAKDGSSFDHEQTERFRSFADEAPSE